MSFAYFPLSKLYSHVLVYITVYLVSSGSNTLLLLVMLLVITL